MDRHRSLKPDSKCGLSRVFSVAVVTLFAIREVAQLFSGRRRTQLQSCGNEVAIISPSSDGNAERHRTASRDFYGCISFLVLSILFGITGGIMYGLSDKGLPNKPKMDDGGILVFVSDPNEQATVNFAVNRSRYFALSVTTKNLGNFW